MSERIVDVHCIFGATAFAPNWGDPSAVRAALRERGITTAFVSSDLAARYDPVAGNDALAGALAATEDVSLRGWLVLHPDRVEDANTQLRRHFGSSRSFVGAALYADPVSGVPVTLRSAQEVITAYRRFSRPLLVETQSAEAMYEAVRIAQEVGTGIRVIASGMGGDEWREAVDLAAKPLNLFLDISGALTPEKIEYALDTLGGARKLLFASGAPATDPAAVLGMLNDLSLNAEDRERILSGNALRLFDAGEVSAPAVEEEAEAPPPSRPAGVGLAPLRPL
ncbi:MAG: amidohydrolase family protein [Cytophagales bacterium]|nr:amidohydrolase family protein [Armatimonadota bacterium]